MSKQGREMQTRDARNSNRGKGGQSKSGRPQNAGRQNRSMNHTGGSKQNGSKKSEKTEIKGIDWDLYDRLYGSKSKKNSDKNHSDNKNGRNGKQSQSRSYGQEKFTGHGKKNVRGKQDRMTVHERQNVRGKQENHSRLSEQTFIKKDGVTKLANGERVCPLHHKCGGCQYQGMEYERQLKHKQEEIQELLGSFGKVERIIGMKDPYHYRNKVHAVFDRDRHGNYISGIYQEGTHDVVPVEECLIEDKRADAIINSIRGLLKSFKIKTYDEDTGYGLLRHVLVRTGYHTDEVMVVLVLSSPILPSKNNFVKALRKLHPEISTIVINVNNKQTSMVLGEKQTTIYGKGYIEDVLCGCRFRISPKSFYQVNPVQTEVLYNKALELAKLDGTQTVIDAYCGIGTIGMVASKQAKEVIGVELNSDAVNDAVVNAKLNEINNITFYNNDATVFMQELAEQGEHVDLVFMDPPRSGSTEEFINAIHALNVKRVVYISCNPETLARDLEYMKKKGYQAKKIVPVDMFAFTEHLENIVLLERKAR